MSSFNSFTVRVNRIDRRQRWKQAFLITFDGTRHCCSASLFSGEAMKMPLNSLNQIYALMHADVFVRTPRWAHYSRNEADPV